MPGETLLIARLPMLVVEALLRGMAPLQLQRRLGNALFEPHNWHQSLSLIYPAHMRDALLAACRDIKATAFAMHIDRLESDGNVPAHIHWRLIPSGGKPAGLVRLLEARRVTFEAHGIYDDMGHGAHTTICYRALQGLPTFLNIPLATWIVDAIELVAVRGFGRTYRYETLEVWPLAPMPEPLMIQQSLPL